MTPKIVGLLVFLGLYWVYCLAWGLRGAMSSKTAGDFFLAGRELSFWVVLLAATAMTFSGWTLIGHPDLIRDQGFAYGFTSLAAIAIPLTGVLFLKRQWILGRRFSFVTPGDMFAYYFRSEAMRLLVTLLALAVSLPFLALMLSAAGSLFHMAGDGLLPVEAAVWIIAAPLLIYVAAGGLRAAVEAGALQALMLGLCLILLGAIVLSAGGGWGMVNAGIAAFAENGSPLTNSGYSHYLAVPGVFQTVPDVSGSPWSGTLILTTVIALMGIQSSPSFSMWAFASRTAAPFAPHQVWASGACFGAILLIFSAIQGLGSHVLGDASTLPAPTNNDQPLFAHLIAGANSLAPWLTGLLAVLALGGLQAAGALYLSTVSTMVTRDLVKRFFAPRADDARQMLIGRLAIAALLLLALLLATGMPGLIPTLGHLAMAYGVQMWPALIAVCYWPFLTRSGVTLGLAAGLVTATLASSTGGTDWQSFPALGSIVHGLHAAVLGLVVNIVIAVVVSALSREHALDLERKAAFHTVLYEHAAQPAEREGLMPLAWIVTLFWFFFAVGPGVVIGNWIFGDPTRADSWFFGVPSIWAWQILFWGLGVLLLWFLAYVMQLSTAPDTDIEPLAHDIADLEPPLRG